VELGAKEWVIGALHSCDEGISADWVSAEGSRSEHSTKTSIFCELFLRDAPVVMIERHGFHSEVLGVILASEHLCFGRIYEEVKEQRLFI